jgi:hypothetical protein
MQVSPADDAHHEGTDPPDRRDDAQVARNTLLRSLLDRTGEEAHRAVRTLAESAIPVIRRERLLELARGMAERDAEIERWHPAQVLALERMHVGPILTADDLMRVVLRVLDDACRDLSDADASSRQLIAAASNEDQVQNWLAEQLRLRSKDRYHVHREPEVAERNEPDIVISAIGAPVELAIEIEHGGKTWSVADLETALTGQLVDDYLRTPSRRRGILVVTFHGVATWKAPEDGAALTFDAVIRRLKARALTIGSNATGLIVAAVVGIDTTRTGSGTTCP